MKRAYQEQQRRSLEKSDSQQDRREDIDDMSSAGVGDESKKSEDTLNGEYRVQGIMQEIIEETQRERGNKFDQAENLDGYRNPSLEASQEVF